MQKPQISPLFSIESVTFLRLFSTICVFFSYGIDRQKRGLLSRLRFSLPFRYLPLTIDDTRVFKVFPSQSLAALITKNHILPFQRGGASWADAIAVLLPVVGIIDDDFRDRHFSAVAEKAEKQSKKMRPAQRFPLKIFHFLLASFSFHFPGMGLLV